MSMNRFEWDEERAKTGINLSYRSRPFSHSFLSMMLLSASLGLPAVSQASVPVKGRDLADQVRKKIIEKLSQPGVELEVEILLPPRDLTVPKGTVSTQIQLPRVVQFSRLSSIPVTLLHEKRPYKTILVQVRVKQYAMAVTTSRRMSRNQNLSAADLKLERVELNRPLDDYILSMEAVTNKRLTRSLAPQTPLLKRFIEEVPFIQRGDVIPVILESGPIELTYTVMAQGEGNIGDLIKVLNLHNNQTLVARVGDDGRLNVPFLKE